MCLPFFLSSPAISAGKFSSWIRRGAARNKAGKLDLNIGGHEIIIQGQIPDYAANIGVTFELPATGKRIVGGYSVEAGQAANVHQALLNSGKKGFEKLDTGNGAVTFIFEL